MRYVVLAIVATMLVMGAAPAAVLAQQPDEQLSSEERARRVEELAAQGARAYRSGDFDEAIASFERAYGIEPVPNLLYNIAKSYERQEKYEKAVEYYQRFIVAPEVDSDARQAALDRIDRLREIADLKQEDIDRAERKARNSEADGADVSDEPDTPDELASSNSTALWTMGGGGALLAGGVVFGLMASSSADDVQSAATFDERKSARDSAKTQALVADGFFVAGAAVSAVGLYLYFSGDDAETNSTASTTTFTPWITGQSAGVGMSLDF